MLQIMWLCLHDTLSNSINLNYINFFLIGKKHGYVRLLLLLNNYISLNCDNGGSV